MIMVFQGGLPDNGEIINFEIEEEPKWVKVKLEDGSVIQIKMEIVAIMKGGNDPNNCSSNIFTVTFSE